MRTVYHRPTDMFAQLMSVDTRSMATIDHPYLGLVTVPCADLEEGATPHISGNPRNTPHP